MAGDDGINDHQNDERYEEEEANGADEVGSLPRGVGLCQTNGVAGGCAFVGSVNDIRLVGRLELSDEQHRTTK